MTTPSATTQPQPNIEDEKQFLEAYGIHATTLRNWLVAYGIGAPVLFLTNETLAVRLAQSPNTSAVVGLFLWAIGLQVGMAALNKAIMWACYYRERNLAQCHNKLPFRFAYWLSEQFVIDLIMDLATLALLLWGTLKAFDLLALR